MLTKRILAGISARANRTLNGLPCFRSLEPGVFGCHHTVVPLLLLNLRNIHIVIPSSSSSGRSVIRVRESSSSDASAFPRFLFEDTGRSNFKDMEAM